MADKIKVNNFLKDVTSSMRAEKRRKNAIKKASKENRYLDPIRELNAELHPGKLDLVITDIEEVSPTAKEIYFARVDGKKFPPFLAGMYVSLDVKIGEVNTSRPYSICSAPYQARLGKDPFIAITVRNGKPNEGFVANYLYEQAKVGDHLGAHVPYGFFYYEPLRDSKNLVALAGGSGITPFYSMAEEIVHGKQDSTLTILYGSASHDDIILEKKLEALAKESDKIRIVHVLSGEKAKINKGDEKGFLTAEIIKKHMGEDPTFFVCGPLPMYQFVEGELKKIGIARRRIHMEVFGAPRKIELAKGHILEAGKPQKGEAKAYSGKKEEVYRLTVYRGLEKTIIEARADEPITVALERGLIPTSTRCRSGACGYCRAKLLKGKVFVPEDGDGRRMADKENSYIHSCSTYPLSDIEVKIDIE